MQIVLFTFLTMYVTPLTSLIPDLGATPNERLTITVWTSVFWALGMVTSAMGFFLGPALFGLFPDTEIGHMRAWQVAIAALCFLGFVGMLIPVLVINEPKWSRNEPSSVPILQSLQTCLSNKYYRYLVASDFCTFCATSILQSGMVSSILLVGKHSNLKDHAETWSTTHNAQCTANFHKHFILSHRTYEIDCISA
jgi:glycoside/pentoside/hexuronide:cation symporter, GPH family